MNSKEFIETYKIAQKSKELRFRSTVKNYSVAGEPLVKCRDAVMENGTYSGLRLTDIFIFNPWYIDYLISRDYIDPELRQIAEEVKVNQSMGEESISREIAME